MFLCVVEREKKGEKEAGERRGKGKENLFMGHQHMYSNIRDKSTSNLFYATFQYFFFKGKAERSYPRIKHSSPIQSVQVTKKNRFIFNNPIFMNVYFDD